MPAMKKLFANLLAVLLIILTLNASAQKAPAGKVWTTAKANAWYAQHKWMSGADFIPSSAINQLEMWQADTFDPATIDRELGYAEGIGFNTMRVFLYSLAWKQDKAGFKKRVDQYLTIANKHGIKTMFVFFDDCWNADAKTGKQPAPKTGIHNSGWLQDPGNRLNNTGETAMLQAYVTDVLTTFKHDKRILLWDLYNEPGNSNKKEASLGLLTKVFAWARAVNPDQPISAGLWDWNFEKLNTYQALNSDVITYHDYTDEASHLKTIQLLKSHGRPLICTEYMARTRGSKFANIMPMLKKENVGALNWGFVMGKTNTIYAWDNPMPDGSEPKEWFHDIFRKDGTPYRAEEVELIKKLNGK
jgi:endo-1,4-beta-mannosidase